LEDEVDKLRIGVIGSGYWGPNLIRNFVEIPNADVVGVADLNPDRLTFISSRYPKVKVTEDYQDLFKMKLDAVVIATPPPSHYQLAMECLGEDLHVLVEKPLTLSSRTAKELVDFAAERDLILMVGHTFEYNPAVRALRDLIQTGTLGTIYYIDGVRANLGLFQRDLNVVWDLATHDISILLYILGMEPKTVSAQGSACVFDGVHDIAYLHFNFPENILAHIRISWLDPCKVRRITVVGSKKMAVYDDVESLEKIRIYDKGVEVPPYTSTYEEFQLSYRYGDVVIPHISHMEPLRIECNHFLESIQKNKQPLSNGESGLRVVKVLEAAERSLANYGQQELLLDTRADFHAEVSI
jgi:predicted dehydrogenase